MVKMIKKSLEQVINNRRLLEMINGAGINTLEELCSYSRRRLMEKGIGNLYVKDIAIALQCEGLDLKNK